MMVRIDAAVIALHQKAVDQFQQEPDNLVKWCVKIGAMLALVKCLLLLDEGVSDWLDMFNLLMQPVSVLCLFFLSKFPRPGDRRFRLFALLMAVIPFNPTANAICSQLAAMNLVCMLYFIACDKPKPPRRKASARLALN